MLRAEARDALNEPYRDRLGVRKADGALGRVVVLKLCLESFQDRPGIESAVVPGRAVSYQEFSLETKGRESIADALFRFRRRSLDGLSEHFERGTLVLRHPGQVLVRGLGFSPRCCGLFAGNLL